MNNHVKAILGTLKEIGLAWIAEEIEATIQSGKSILKDIPETGTRRIRKASWTIPLSDDEQIAICLLTIKAYFLDLREVWSSAQSYFKETEKMINASNLNLQISELESNEPIQLFTPSYEIEKKKLSKIIEKALQSIGKDYH